MVTFCAVQRMAHGIIDGPLLGRSIPAGADILASRFSEQVPSMRFMIVRRIEIRPLVERTATP
jgi:hypothetical protein